MPTKISQETFTFNPRWAIHTCAHMPIKLRHEKGKRRWVCVCVRERVILVRFYVLLNILTYYNLQNHTTQSFVSCSHWPFRTHIHLLSLPSYYSLLLDWIINCEISRKTNPSYLNFNNGYSYSIPNIAKWCINKYPKHLKILIGYFRLHKIKAI